MTRACWLMLVVVAWTSLALSAEGEWKAYTAKRDVRDLAAAPSLLWAATSGGAFSYEPAGDTYRQLTTADGLATNDLTAVAVDHDGNVWFGASDGSLQRLVPATLQWLFVTDIRDKEQPQKRINALRVAGDTLFILSDLGVGLFSLSRGEFIDTYLAYGTTSSRLSGMVLDMTTYHGLRWIATRAGIASTTLQNPNPAVPESWQVYNHTAGLPSDIVTSLGVLHDTLFAGTSSGLAYFDGTVWHAVPSTAGLSIVGLTFVPDVPGARPMDFIHGNLLMITQSQLLACLSAGEISVLGQTTGAPLTKVLATPSLRLATAGDGIAFATDTPWTYHRPPGPPTNNFDGIAVDGRGTIWSGTGAVSGSGFVSFDGTNWRIYSTATNPELGSNDFFKIAIGANDAVWALNWGSGAAIVGADGSVAKVLSSAHGLPPSVDPSFVVVGGIAPASDGSTWIAERTPPGDTSLVVLRPDGTLSYVVGCGAGCSMRNPSNVFTDIVIDQNGTKWFANFSRFEPFVPNRLSGFYYYNDQYALPGTSSGWGKLTTADGLPSAQVWALAVDRDNAVWVGTDQGLSIIFDPSDPRAHVASYYPPPQNKVIQSIVVDPLNNKWIGTKEGVFVLSPDGTSILTHYTVENTGGRLLDNDVNSIAIDAHSGFVYFGTEKGLCGVKTSAVAPLAAYGDLVAAPNPFYLPSAQPLQIDGLTQNSTIKILRIDGALVRELPTPGGRVAFWDGKDRAGRYVATGIYMVIAYTEGGAGIGKGKIAVIRR